jgi:FkbM family methyltransferase
MQRLLKRTHLYGRLKESVVYDLFWAVCNSRLLEERGREIEFYKRELVGLSLGSIIFDIGANHGAKTSIFLRLGARVVAVDPDKTNQKMLKDQFARYRLARKPVAIVGKAVSDRVGVTRFWIDEPGSAKNTLNRKWVDILREDRVRFGERLEFAGEVEVATTTLEHLIAKYGSPFFIKIDVEGHEANVIRGLKHAVPFLSFEVNLPEFRDEGVECVASLERLSPGGRFNYVIGNIFEMASTNWLRGAEIIEILKDCDAPSVEVFWNSDLRPTS